MTLCNRCIYYSYMTKVLLNVKTDKEIKEKARETARSLGMPLSTIINAYLTQFIRTEEVHFYLEGELKLSAKKRLDKLQKEALTGKNLSPTFKSAKEAIKYLNS